MKCIFFVVIVLFFNYYFKNLSQLKTKYGKRALVKSKYFGLIDKFRTNVPQKDISPNLGFEYIIFVLIFPFLLKELESISFRIGTK